MKKAIVIGSGAGGAAAARELQGKYAVTVLEAGNEFRPFSMDLKFLGSMRKTGLFFDEREIQLIFPAMQVRKTKPGKLVLVNGIGTGGTTTLSAGNALRADSGLKDIGIDLDQEFAELERDLPISTAHEKLWRPVTRRVYAISQEMQLRPKPTPKMGDFDRCISCGRCVLGCAKGVKWDSRRFLREAVSRGTELIINCKVERIETSGGRASGVFAIKKGKRAFFAADLIIVAAGGFATPAILKNSGIPCEAALFVDPVLCVATAWPEARQNHEIPMPFVCQQPHYILSPYFDHLSFFFNKNWRMPAENILSLMIKLADTRLGDVTGRKITKVLTNADEERLREGVEVCCEIFARLGVKRDAVFLGTLNAGHPGGMLPLGEKEAATFHNSRLPENVYVADASLFPVSLGNPPILTIMAMAKRVAKVASS